MKTLKHVILPVLFTAALWLSAGPAQHTAVGQATYTLEKTTQDTVTWQRPRFDSRRQDRHRMVEQAIRELGITDMDVLQAMRHVPRHLFVPRKIREYAYQNRPLPIGYEQTISQPYIVGYMTQMLNLNAGEKVLEIGTGSGYQAAVLSEITPHVFTIEIVEELGRLARTKFDSLGYKTIRTRIGDGYNGWPKYAPFDAIILTAAAEEIPEPLKNQLKKGGVLVMPKGETGETQMLIKVIKTEDGTMHIEQRLPVRFVPMTGEIRQHE